MKKKECDEITSFEVRTEDGEIITSTPVNDDTSYCYACLVRNDDGKEWIVGFTSTFDMLHKLAQLYIDSLAQQGISGLYYAGFERCSSRRIATCIKVRKEHNVVSVIATYGIFYEDEISVIITPQNIVMHERDLK